MANKRRGFTIIELIVVIAIIAVLAAIVLVNVTKYIVQSNDAAAMANLDSLVTSGTVYFDTHGSYNGFVKWASGLGNQCVSTADPSYLSVCNALTNAGYGNSFVATCDTGLTCTGTPTKWCADVLLKQYSTMTYYCVDSSGKKETTTLDVPSSCCPVSGCTQTCP